MSRARAASALLVALGASSAFGGAAPRADLVVSTLSVSQSGAKLHVRDVVRNRGDATAPASRSAYYLGQRRIGTRVVARLLARASSRGSWTFVIPPAFPQGSVRLRACADAGRRVQESNERNNCRVAARVIVVGDVTPPKFGGLERATTCVPGPVGGTTRYTPYGLRWQPATDNVTAASAIVYEIFEAQTSGGEDFSNPTYTSKPGATEFVTPPLSDSVPHYFVVRAVDRAGNRDANKVERLGMNLCV